MKKTRLKPGRSCWISGSQILAERVFPCLPFRIRKMAHTLNGGEIGYKLKGELEKPYADAAWSLSTNTVSRIVETKYGFHNNPGYRQERRTP
jgi:hypothetical protein